MTDETIARLEKWNAGHKARAVKISVGDGYGATCWTVELHCEKLPGGYSDVYAAECSFWEGEPIPNAVFLMGDADDWPGLAAVINAAIDRFEELRAA